MLDLIVSIDEHVRGFAGDFLRASSERMQVIAAYLAVKAPVCEDMVCVGRFLIEASHRAILAAAYSDVPTGFRQALSRIGSEVQDQRCYTLLYETLSRPPSDEVQQCIFRMPSIDRQKLLIARLLPSALVRPNVIGVIYAMGSTNSASLANDVTTAFDLLVSRGVDREALAQAICKVRSERELMNLWQRWLAKAECPQHPVPDDMGYSAITSGDQLREASLRYRNCGFDRYLLGLIEGTDAFAEFSFEGRSVMVRLRLLDDHITFDGAFGPQNARPPAPVRDALVRYLSQHGVVVPTERRKASQWQAIARLSRASLFEFDFE